VVRAGVLGEELRLGRPGRRLLKVVLRYVAAAAVAPFVL
jgi:hypothetical protein